MQQSHWERRKSMTPVIRYQKTPSLADTDGEDQKTTHAVQIREVPAQPSTSDANSTILLCALCMILPMLIFTSVFISLVYNYRVSSTTPAHHNLIVPGSEQDTGYLYVKISSTVLIFIASWSSSLAPLLSGTAMCLVVLPVARGLLDTSRAGIPDQSLTPMQLALTLKFIDGSAGSALWSWWLYLSRWREKRAAQPRSLTIPATCTLAMFLLSFLVFLADTWLHITTSTVNLVQSSSVDVAKPYGSSVKSPACTSFNGSVNAAYTRDHDAEPCSLMKPAGLNNYPSFSNVSAQVVNNISETMRVYSDTPDPGMAYLGAARPSQAHDYTATSFGARTQCKPITKSCNVNLASGVITPFQCTEAWAGELSTAPNGLILQYFTNETLLDNYTANGIRNPFCFSIAHILRNSVGGNLSALEIESPGDVVSPSHGGAAFVLSCRTTMYDVEYDFVNGTVTRFVSQLSNDSVANLWQSAPSQGRGSFDVAPYLLSAMNIAPMGAKNMQDIADSIAASYNRIALGVGAYSLTTAPTSALQIRDSILVTRMPVAPFVCLIIANLLFVVLGVALTVIALMCNSAEICDAASRLSIVGLVADRFECSRAAVPTQDMEEMFEEGEGRGSSKICIERTDAGGYEFKTWSNFQVVEGVRRRT